jgi:hypothetical protein
VALLTQIHLHGHDFLIIAEGKGIFTDSVLATSNLINPPRRDVVTMPASDPNANVTGGYLVIAFNLNNPGTWVRTAPPIVNDSFCIVILHGMSRWDWVSSSWNEFPKYLATLE